VYHSGEIIVVCEHLNDLGVENLLAEVLKEAQVESIVEVLGRIFG